MYQKYNPFKKQDDRESLERVKRWPSIMNKLLFVRIYSREHKAYWRGTGQGYTIIPNESTILSIRKAFKMTRHCGAEKQIQFIKVVNEIPISQLETDFATCGWYENDGICQRGKEALAVIKQLQDENRRLNKELNG